MKIIPIHLMPLNMVKSFAIRGKKTILIDTGFQGSSIKILKKMHEENIRKEDVSLIVLTHSHADHSGSAKELKEVLKVPVAIHQAEAKDLEKGNSRPYYPTSLAGKIWKRMPPAKAKFEAIKPDIVFGDELDLSDFGVNGKTIHTPGHTPGSISVNVEDKIIIAGDLLAGGSIIGGIYRHARPMLPPFHEDIPETKNSIEKILSIDPEVIHICHGGPLDVRLVRKMLNDYNWKNHY